MAKQDKDTSIQELKDLVAKFRDERDWAKHHTPKNLAISIAIEAAELMELFQWDDYSKSNKQKMSEELADILIYSFNFAETYGIDIATSFKAKLEAAAKKYPKEVFSGGNDTPDDYHQAKLAYRKAKK
jgi:dCTP diphosphatase